MRVIYIKLQDTLDLPSNKCFFCFSTYWLCSKVQLFKPTVIIDMYLHRISNSKTPETLIAAKRLK